VWGQVALHVSVSDIFDETLHPDDPLRYDRSGRWVDVERRVETIQVRLAAPEEVEVLSTHHGPLLSSVLPGDDSVRAYALAWTGHADDSGIASLLRLQGARNWEQFRAALADYPAPVSSFLYADTAGNIGRQVAGHLPLRPIDTGLLPVQGRTRYYDWRGYVEFDELPSDYGSNLPWIVASPRAARDRFPTPVSWLWSSGGSAQRVEQRLSKGSRLTLRDVVEIQRERRSARGPASVQRLLRGVQPNSDSARRIHQLLLDWDGSTATDSVGASVYHAFVQRLTRRLLNERLGARLDLVTGTPGDDLASAEPLPGVLLARFADRVRHEWEPAEIHAALEETWSWLSVEVSPNPARWGWGSLHQLRLEHSFERLGSGLLAGVGHQLGRGPLAVPGDADSIWSMHGQGAPLRFAGVGPAMRYAVDLGDVDHALVGLAGGQSGHPGDARYDDALADWLRGAPRPLWMHWNDVEHHEAGTWVVEPALP